MDLDPMEQERLRELFGFGRPGEPVPRVDPEDLKAVWMLGREVKKDHPGESVGIDVEIFERTCKPGANIPAVAYRTGVIAMFLRHAPQLQDKLDAVFRAAAEIPMEWIGVGITHHGWMFDTEDLVRRVREAA